MRKYFLSFLLLASVLVLFFACRKTELQPEMQQAIAKTNNEYARFFSVPASASLQVKAVAEAVKKQNEKYNFLSSVVKNAGYPFWDKARIANLDTKTFASKSAAADSLGGEVVYVPFALDSTNTTSAVLAVHLNDPDTTYRMLYKPNYRLFGYDTANNSKWNARDVFHLFTTFDYTVFRNTRFLIKDDSLFKRPNDSMYVLLTIKTYQGQNVSGKTALDQWLDCTTYQECHYFSYPGFDPNGIGVRSSSANDYCFLYDICTLVSGGSGGGWTGGGNGSNNPGGWWNSSGNPSGGSGNGGGNQGGSPCSGVNARNTQNAPGDGCGQGWVPINNNNNDLLPPYVINEMTKPCLISVLKKLSGRTQNTFFKQIYNTFDTSTNFVLGFRDSAISGAYGLCFPPMPLISGGNYIDIAFDNTTLLQSSREWMAYVMVHEVAHAAMFANIRQWDTLNSQHVAMAGQYLTSMANSLTIAYPGLSEFDAYAMCFAGFFNGVEGNPTPEDVAFSRVIAKRIRSKFGVSYTNTELAVLGRQFTETGTKGTRGNCN